MLHNLFVKKGLVTMACSTFPTQRAGAYPSVHRGGWLTQIITITVTFSPLKAQSLHAVEQHNHQWPNSLTYRIINTWCVMERLEFAGDFFSRINLNAAHWASRSDRSWCRTLLIEWCLMQPCLCRRGAFQPKQQFNPPIPPSGLLWWAARSLFTPQLSPH